MQRGERDINHEVDMEFSFDGKCISMTKRPDKGRPYTIKCRKNIMRMVINHFERHPLDQTDVLIRESIPQAHQHEVEVALSFLTHIGSIIQTGEAYHHLGSMVV